jgi:glycosyltransferase involved in cell wall biosynthesis
VSWYEIECDWSPQRVQSYSEVGFAMTDSSTEKIPPQVSIIVPAYNEGATIGAVLRRFAESVQLPYECLVVVDFPEDPTVAAVKDFSGVDTRFRAIVNTFGRGPGNAIRFGVAAAAAPVLVVTMADGSDDPRQIDDLVRLVERGVVVAAASRYMAGGQQVGGPLLKSTMSRTAGLSLRALARVGTTDATNSFKAYSTEFVRSVGIDSREGFVLGLELTVKARRLGLPVAEIPTIWLERSIGESNFDVAKWAPHYLRWYRFAFGPRLTLQELKRRTRRLGLSK